MYLAAVVLGAVLPLFGLLAVGQSVWFFDHSTYPALAMVGYGETLRGANCEILVYGDSSALTGIDPHILQQVTGMSACNIAEGTTVQNVTGSDGPLRHYLSHNKPPRVLLTFWTPTLFVPDRPPQSFFSVEGMNYAWRYGSGLRFSRQTARWTWSYLTWLSETVGTFLRRFLSHNPIRPTHPQWVRAARRGQYPYPRQPETHCTKDYSVVHLIPHADSVDAFRRKYSTPTTTVLVDMTPVPVCDPLYTSYVSVEKGTYDNVLQRYPIEDFNEGDVHLSPQGADRMTREAAAQILALLHRR